MTYQPHFDIDRQFGEAGEETVRSILGLSAEQIEVKRPRWKPDTLFIEVQHKPRSLDYYLPSGLSVTQATYWVFVYGEAMYVYPTTVLRLAVQLDRRPLRNGGINGDNPTKGHIFTHRYIGDLAQSGRAA